MNNSLTIQGVKKTYPHSDTAALAGIDLSIPAGCAFGLIGPNGAGKSTLIRLILGLLKPDAGRMLIGDHDLASALPAARRICGLAPQDPGFFPLLTVAENLRTFGAAAGLRGAALTAAVHAAIESTELSRFAHRRADQLSGGVRQRLNVSLALLGHPPILLLDEPTAGVDAESRRLILDVLRQENQRGTTLIYTSHYLTEVEQLCDRVALIDHGRVRFEGQLQAALAHAARLLVVRLGSPPPADMVARWDARWPGGDIEHDTLTLETDQPVEALGQLAQDGVTLRSIEYGTSSLEAAYFHMRAEVELT